MKIQKQVHPRQEIEEKAVAFLEELIFQLLAQICAAQVHTIADVEAHVQKNFTAPIDTWALTDAQLTMDKHKDKKKGVFMFPVEKIYQQLQKDVFEYKVELNVVQFIMAILDYISADILKLAGNFVKNTRKPAVYINITDIRVSMAADPALQALFQPLQGGHSLIKDAVVPYSQEETTAVVKDSSYTDYLRDLLEGEAQYIRFMSLILKLFKEPFQQKPALFPQTTIDTIFGNLTELHELAVQFQCSLEECIEMSAEADKDEERHPQAGFVFEDLAEQEEFSAYCTYASNYMLAVVKLEEMFEDQEVVEYLKAQQPPLFKEAVQYILPKSLLEPIYHCFHYFEVMTGLQRSTKSEDDEEALESAMAIMLTIKLELERECARFLPKRKDDMGMFRRRFGSGVALMKVSQLQEKIEGWEGPDLNTTCSELLLEGTLGVAKEGSRRAHKSDRYVFLLDGLCVCTKRKRGSDGFRLKEMVSMRKVKLIDIEEAEDMKFAFQLSPPDQPGTVFFANSKPDKNEWLAALTHLLTRSTFERILDSKLSEEESMIPVLRPSPDVYRFAEEDSDETIMFDDVKDNTQGQGQLIKAGTIHKLVERLTYHEYADPAFVRTFLMTYRSFCKPSELLNLLMQRHQIPNPIDLDDSDVRRDPLKMKAYKRFKTNYVSPIQLRVLNVIRHWIEFHFYDFVNDPALLAVLKQFVDSVKTKSMQKLVASIQRAFQKKEEEAAPSEQLVFDKHPEPTLWFIAKPNATDEFNFLTLHPVEIARQLTLLQSEYFRAIHPSELVDASWMKEERKESSSPNLLKLNRFETKVSNWITKEIVYTENFEERVALVSRLIDIMEVLKDLNNFAGMFVVNAAFESSAVYRLKSTLGAVPAKKLIIFEEMKVISSSENNFSKYKERLRNINPPCVPFLGMYMSWIVFIKDGNENKIVGKPENFINFKKRRKLADVLHEIQQYQNTPYCIKSESNIRKWIVDQDPTGDMTTNQWEEQAFEQSRIIEPKDQPPKKVPRKYKFDLRPPQDKPGAWNTLGFVKNKRSHPSIPSFQEEGGASPSGDQEIPSSPTTGSPTPLEDSTRTRSVSTPNLHDPPPIPRRPINRNSSTMLPNVEENEDPFVPSPPCPSLPPKPPRDVPPRPPRTDRAPPPIPARTEPPAPPLPPRQR
ncbi:hypothetical protein EMCRGX_G032266 [Ephydatia muelleri]